MCKAQLLIIDSLTGLDRIETDAAAAGEIVSIAGVKNGGVNITLVAPDGWSSEGPQPLPVRQFFTTGFTQSLTYYLRPR